MDIQNIEDLVELIKSLKRKGDLEGAKNILLQCVEFMDLHYGAEDQKPPWYHEQLGVIYRKLGQLDIGNDFSRKSDEIILHNFYIQALKVNALEDWIRADCYPNGPVITKKVLDAAQRLYKEGAATVLKKLLLESSNATSVSK